MGYNLSKGREFGDSKRIYGSNMRLYALLCDKGSENDQCADKETPKTLNIMYYTNVWYTFLFWD